MPEGPEDRQLASIWSDQPRGDRWTFRAGEVYLSITEMIVWLPFLVLLVTGWIALVVVLPTGMGEQFVDLTLGWLVVFDGEFSARVLVALVGNLAALAAVFYLYTRIYGALVGRLLEFEPR